MSDHPDMVDRLVAESLAEYAEKAEREAAEEPPPCAWCSDPAAEQVLTGRRPTKEGKPRAVYAWMCQPCATYFKEEKEHSRGQ